MSEVVQAFARALSAEREAALRADFDGLLRVQEEKRALLPLLKETADPAIVEELSEQARKNLRLLRHLLLCVEGTLGITAAAPTYNASGQNAQRAFGAQATVRGRL
jgi:hypothetical protein